MCRPGRKWTERRRGWQRLSTLGQYEIVHSDPSFGVYVLEMGLEQKHLQYLIGRIYCAFRAANLPISILIFGQPA